MSDTCVQHPEYEDPQGDHIRAETRLLNARARLLELDIMDRTPRAEEQLEFEFVTGDAMDDAPAGGGMTSLKAAMEAVRIGYDVRLRGAEFELPEEARVNQAIKVAEAAELKGFTDAEKK